MGGGVCSLGTILATVYFYRTHKTYARIRDALIKHRANDLIELPEPLA